MKPNVVANASAARISLFFLFKEISNGQESCLWSVRKFALTIDSCSVGLLILDETGQIYHFIDGALYARWNATSLHSEPNNYRGSHH